MSEPIMTFHIKIDRPAVSQLDSGFEKAVIIPFTGTAESSHFNGKILPGAADVQTTDAAGIRHMCAKYMFEGVDHEGKRCRLFVENNGYFEPGSEPSPFHACPVFMSNSSYLNNLLAGPFFRSEGHPSASGVDILIYDTRLEGKTVPEIDPEPLDPWLLERTKADIPENFWKEAVRIAEEEGVKKMVLFSDHKGQTYVVDHPDTQLLAAVIYDVLNTNEMLFMINEKDELAAVCSIVGKLRNIEDATITVFGQIFEETGQAQYFERPIHTYRRWRIRETAE